MNIQSERNSIAMELANLNRQASETASGWNDSVKHKFYQQFIDYFPGEVNSFLFDLDKLNSDLRSARHIINGLRP